MDLPPPFGWCYSPPSLLLAGAALGGAAFPSFFGVVLLSPLGCVALSSLLQDGAALSIPCIPRKLDQFFGVVSSRSIFFRKFAHIGAKLSLRPTILMSSIYTENNIGAFDENTNIPYVRSSQFYCSNLSPNFRSHSRLANGLPNNLHSKEPAGS